MEPGAPLPPVGMNESPPVPTGSAEVAPQPDAQAQPLATSDPLPLPGGNFIYVLAVAATVLWAGGLTAYTLGFRARIGPFEDENFLIVVLALLGLAPIGLIWIGAYALRQGIRLLGEANRLQTLAHDMVAPAALAASETGSVVEAIRLEIQGAAKAAWVAREELNALRAQLSDQTNQLVEMAGGSATDAKAIVQDLGRERQEFTVLSRLLGERIQDIGDAISRQARMVAEASDLAQTQIQEAEAALAARAADLAAAAGEATETARMAGDDLSRQAARLEQAGVTVGEQVSVVEEGLSQQRAALVALSHAMRAEQEDLAVHFESRRAQLAEVLRQAEQGALQAGEAAGQSAQSLRDLLAAAAEQLREMGDQAQTERDLLSGAALQSLGALSEASGFERRALEDDTRRAIDELSAAAERAERAAERAAEAARAEVEALAQAALAASKSADDNFEAQLDDAKAFIERTAKLVDEAGVRSTAKLEEGVNQAFAAMELLQRNLSEIEARARALPAEAEMRGHEVRTALDAANAALVASARASAKELESIDSAFQERVKRNYEMLSEAVRLMGVLGGGAAARAAATPAPAPRPAPSVSPALPPLPLRRRETAAPTASAPPPEPAAEDTLRPRLKLSRSEEPRFEEDDDHAPPAPADPDLTWNELVAALDDGDADDAELERRLIAEIEALGIDAAALIPRRRLDDVARLYETGDASAAHEAVHRLAPAAVRKLARRVLSDKLLRARADRLIERYHGLLQGISRRGGDGFTVVSLLSSDAGRAFLLLDAALGDLG